MRIDVEAQECTLGEAVTARRVCPARYGISIKQQTNAYSNESQPFCVVERRINAAGSAQRTACDADLYVPTQYKQSYISTCTRLYHSLLISAHKYLHSGVDFFHWYQCKKSTSLGGGGGPLGGLKRRSANPDGDSTNKIDRGCSIVFEEPQRLLSTFDRFQGHSIVFEDHFNNVITNSCLRPVLILI